MTFWVTLTLATLLSAIVSVSVSCLLHFWRWKTLFGTQNARRMIKESHDEIWRGVKQVLHVR